MMVWVTCWYVPLVIGISLQEARGGWRAVLSRRAFMAAGLAFFVGGVIFIRVLLSDLNSY